MYFTFSMGHVLTDLFSWVSVVHQVAKHKNDYFLVICVGVFHGFGVAVRDQTLEALRGFMY